LAQSDRYCAVTECPLSKVYSVSRWRLAEHPACMLDPHFVRSPAGGSQIKLPELAAVLGSAGPRMRPVPKTTPFASMPKAVRIIIATATATATAPATTASAKA
jgi:hypothetical protein